MNQKEALRNIRKEYITEEIVEVSQNHTLLDQYSQNNLTNLFYQFQDTEICPKCESSNERNYLRFFFVNLDEAIYKCSSPKCLYPFKDFKFKNFKERNFYIYKPIELDVKDLEVNEHQFDIIDSIPADIAAYFYDEKDTNPFSTETCTQNQFNANIDEFDFDFSANLFDETIPTSQNSNNSQSDFDHIDAFLDEIIKEQEQQEAVNELPNIPPVIASSDDVVKIEPEPNLNESVVNTLCNVPVSNKKTAKSKKLTKCLEHIQNTVETGPKKKRSYVRKKKVENAIKEEINEKVIKEENVEQVEKEEKPVILSPNKDVKLNKLKQLMDNKNNLKPTDLLKTLQTLGYIQFSNDSMKKNGAVPNIKSVVSSTTSEKSLKSESTGENNLESSDVIPKTEPFATILPEVKMRKQRKKKTDATNTESTQIQVKPKRKPANRKSQMKIEKETEIKVEQASNVINCLVTISAESEYIKSEEITKEAESMEFECSNTNIEKNNETPLDEKRETIKTEIIYPKTIELSDSETDNISIDLKTRRSKGKKRVSNSVKPRNPRKKIAKISNDITHFNENFNELTIKDEINKAKRQPKDNVTANEKTDVVKAEPNQSRRKRTSTAAGETIVSVINELPNDI